MAAEWLEPVGRDEAPMTFTFDSLTHAPRTPRRMRFGKLVTESPKALQRSVVKAIADLGVNLPRTVEMRSAEGEAVIDQQMAVRDVQPGQ